ncbi:MAG: 4-demethylwyosine synthase TYW1 [Candidatus Altiarchaeota archaeon]|nr:4-demethylwyosine synthase TYW1 [Candidatus Altiarchaeota archaeon]
MNKTSEFERMGYRFEGTGSVEICRWNKNAITGRGVCYKQKFYGVPTHKCMEFTPSTLFCNNNCVYCWRPSEFLTIPKNPDWTEPEVMVESLIKKRKALLMGFKGNPKTNQELFKEAVEPTHFAISLSGEPTLYPKLSRLIEYLNNRKGTFSTFLVTNGQCPETLKGLKTLPTQIYLSLTAPNSELYKRISVPLERGAWELLMDSCKFLSSVPTRTVSRITLMKNMNMVDVKGWKDIIEASNAHFIEFKGYSWIGFSRERLQLSNVPTLEEVKEFASEVMEGLDFEYMDEDKKSRIVVYKNRSRPIDRFIRIINE